MSLLSQLELLGREQTKALDEGRYDEADDIERQMTEIHTNLRYKGVINDLCESQSRYR